MVKQSMLTRIKAKGHGDDNPSSVYKFIQKQMPRKKRTGDIITREEDLIIASDKTMRGTTTTSPPLRGLLVNASAIIPSPATSRISGSQQNGSIGVTF